MEINTTGFFSQKSNRALGSLVLIMLVVALVAYAFNTFKQARFNYDVLTISVVGEGEVNALPDIGMFNFSVRAIDPSAEGAQQQVNERLENILAFLADNEVEEKDIKTSYYNLSPNYRYETGVCAAGMYCPSRQVQDGFEVNQNVSVKVRDLDKAGALISGVGEQKADDISGLQFVVDDTAALKDQARQAAIADAKARAEILAKQLGVNLKRMTSYYEDEGYYPVPYRKTANGLMLEESMADTASVSLPSGENTVTSRVTLVYEIR